MEGDVVPLPMHCDGSLRYCENFRYWATKSQPTLLE